jgi:hypothetical protein
MENADGNDNGCDSDTDDELLMKKRSKSVFAEYTFQELRSWYFNYLRVFAHFFLVLNLFYTFNFYPG